MQLNTDSALEKAQLMANRAFARAYEPHATPPARGTTRPRVLVSGFGRFRDHATNATGLMVSRLLPDLGYPFTQPVPEGELEPPEGQLAVAQGTVELPVVGEVELCALVLPVFWDLAAYLVLREIEAFVPDVVVMNGVAGPRQPLWLELGAVNRAKDEPDGSNILRPAVATGPLVARVGDESLARSNLATWDAIASAATDAIAERATVTQGGERFDAVLQGVAFAGFPRASNTYLCNATTYTVGHALDHPGETMRLLESVDGSIELSLASPRDRRFTSVPRWFMHWPSALDGAHLDAATDVLRAAVAAQLVALAEGSEPSRGDNVLAEIPATP